jgi:hypothetical protein
MKHSRFYAVTRSIFFYFLLKNLEDISLASYLCITFESDSKWAEIFQNKKKKYFLEIKKKVLTLHR